MDNDRTDEPRKTWVRGCSHRECHLRYRGLEREKTVIFHRAVSHQIEHLGAGKADVNRAVVDHSHTHPHSNQLIDLETNIETFLETNALVTRAIMMSLIMMFNSLYETYMRRIKK